MILTSAIFLEANSLNLNWLCDTDTNLDALIAEQEELIFTSVFDNNYSEIDPSDIAELQIILKYYAYQLFAIDLRNKHYLSQLIDNTNITHSDPKIIDERLFVNSLELARANFYREVKNWNNLKFTIKPIYYGVK